MSNLNDVSLSRSSVIVLNLIALNILAFFPGHSYMKQLLLT